MNLPNALIILSDLFCILVFNGLRATAEIFSVEQFSPFIKMACFYSKVMGTDSEAN